MQGVSNDLCSTRAQVDRTANVDMPYFCSTAHGIDVQHDADALAQAIGHGDLTRAHQWHLRPAHGASGSSREVRVQVFCNGEDDAGDVLYKEIIAFDHELQ